MSDTIAVGQGTFSPVPDAVLAEIIIHFGQVTKGLFCSSVVVVGEDMTLNRVLQ